MQEGRPPLEHMPLEGPLLTFATYIESVRETARQSGFDTRLGLEVDFVPGKNELIQSPIQGHDWDFLIGSVHEIDDVIYETPHKCSKEEGEALWLRYFDLLRGPETTAIFTSLALPDGIHFTNPHLHPPSKEPPDRLAH